MSAAVRRDPRWRPGVTLGLVVLVPAAVLGATLEPGPLVPSSPWLLLIGLPAGYLLVGLGGLVTSPGRPTAARDVLVAAVVVPLRHRPPIDLVVRALAAATGEELLFRMLGLWALGSGPAGVLLSSAAFAAAHLPGAPPDRRLRTVVDAFLSGLALAALYIATAGLATAILAHFARNVAQDAIRIGLSRRVPRRDTQEGT